MSGSASVLPVLFPASWAIPISWAEGDMMVGRDLFDRW